MNGKFEQMLKECHPNEIPGLIKQHSGKIDFVRALFDVCKDVIVSDGGVITEQLACHSRYGVVPSSLFVSNDGYLLGAISPFACRPTQFTHDWAYVIVAVSGCFLVLTYNEYMDHLVLA